MTDYKGIAVPCNGAGFSIMGKFGASAIATKIMMLPSYLTQQGICKERKKERFSTKSLSKCGKDGVLKCWVRNPAVLCRNRMQLEIQFRQSKTWKLKFKFPVLVDQWSVIQLKHHKLCAFKINIHWMYLITENRISFLPGFF